jgi:methanogenic corrinoid protein MtbC1
LQSLATIGDYLRALSRQDRSAAVDVATRAADARMSVAGVIEQVLAPAQAEIGVLTQRDDWSVADEHAATAITEVVLGVLALRQPTPVPRPAPVVVTTPAGEWHGMAARMVAESLRSRGWDALFLGGDLPDDHLRRFLDRTRPAAVLLSCTMAAALPQLARSVDAATDADIPTIVGGRACGPDEHRGRAVGANGWAPDIEAAHALLSKWIDQGVAPPAAQRARIPAGYLELIGSRTELTDRLTAAADPSERSGDEPPLWARQIAAELVDVLAASLLVDDPRLVESHVDWLTEMLDARGLRSGTVPAVLDALRQAVAGIPNAGRFTGSRGPHPFRT